MKTKNSMLAAANKKHEEQAQKIPALQKEIKSLKNYNEELSEKAIFCENAKTMEARLTELEEQHQKHIDEQ